MTMPPDLPAQVNRLMDGAQLKQWVLRRLGAPAVQVELDDDHLTDAVEWARQWFSAKKGQILWQSMPFYSGQPQYVLADQMDTILDVVPQLPAMDISLVFSPFILQDEKVPYDVFAAPSSLGIYGSYTQTLMYVEQAKRVLGADFNWRQEGRYLWVSPVPKASGFYAIQYKTNRFKVESLNERDHDLVKRYALAKAKNDLGRIRSKYNEYPGAQGPVTLDGERLMQEAAEEIKQLEIEIAASAYPIGFIHG